MLSDLRATPMQAMSEGGNRRMRLNVVAYLSNEVAARFLIVVDEDAGIEALYTKVQQKLQRNGVQGTIAEVRNSFQALVPVEEALGDIFRDGEEVVVMIRGEDGELLQDRNREASFGLPFGRNRGAPCPRYGEAVPMAGQFAVPVGQPAAPAVPHQISMGRSFQHQPETSSVYYSAPPNLEPSSFDGPEPPRFVPLENRHEFSALAGSRDSARILPVTAHVSLPPQFHQDYDSEEEELEADEGLVPPPEEDYPPLPRPPPPPYTEPVPGPVEEFEMERMPYESLKVDHPCDPVQMTCYDDGWLVEHLTPRLRDFIISHFKPEFITEPKYVASIGKYVGAKFLQTSGSFVSVFMRPQTALKSDPAATMPVHYNIPKSELNVFQAKVHCHIAELKEHQEVIQASLRALRHLLTKGKSDSDVVNVMLPVDYHAFAEVEGSMIEMDQPLLPIASGRHPVVIIDTSAAVAEHLFYVKAGVKRALHVHLGSKDSFQLVRFGSKGEPRLWAQDMMAPSELALQKAEDWIDQLVPVERANLVEAVRFALAFKSCDEIYIISSAAFKQSDHEKILSTIRFLNKREAAIHTIGLEADAHAELLLRNISEGNHGDFTLKSFNPEGAGHAIPGHESKWTSWRTMLVNEKTKQLSNNFKQQTMTIGSQIRVLEVMLREEAKFEDGWRQESTCAERLLSKVQECPDRDMVKELERTTTHTMSARVGGGFLYHTRQLDLGMEKLFEHNTSSPWTVQSASMAQGPKVACVDVDPRLPKFPPSLDEPPLAPEEFVPLPPPPPVTEKVREAFAPGRDALRASQGRMSRKCMKEGDTRTCEANPWAPRGARARMAKIPRQRRQARSAPRLKRSSASPSKTVSARVGGGFVYQTQVQAPSTKQAPSRAAEVGRPREAPPAPKAPPPPPAPLERRWSF